MNPAMTTTAFELDGYRIVKNFGVVRGIIVRSRSIFGTIGAGLQTLVGGNITILTDLCEKTRQHALELCVQHAQQSSSACWRVFSHRSVRMVMLDRKSTRLNSSHTV